MLDRIYMHAQWRRLQEQGFTQRQAAKHLNAPRTTFQGWDQKIDHLCQSVGPETAWFFEGEAGRSLLHRQMIAIHICFLKDGAASPRKASQFLKRSQLDNFIASSPELQRLVGEEIREMMFEYEEQEKFRLAAMSLHLFITVALDEAFHEGPCLVAMDPVSGFILLEKLREGYTAEIWAEELMKAIAGLKVTIVQITSDQGPSILACAKNLLNVPQSPDLFHMVRELRDGCRYTLPLRVKAREKDLEEAQGELEQICAEERLALANIKQRQQGRPKDFQMHKAIAREQVEMAEAELAQTTAALEKAGILIQELSRGYNLIDLDTGKMRTATEIEELLQGKTKAIIDLITPFNPSKKAISAINKAVRVIPAMVKTIKFVCSTALERLAELGVTQEVSELVYAKLIPACYLERKSKEKTRTTKKTRMAMHKRSMAMRAEVLNSEIFRNLSPEEIKALLKLATDIAYLFQRSSSCVEGRNGVLSFRHHQLHKVSKDRRRELTILHNYFIVREDGTTAAERFFGHKPRDLFEFLVERVSMLPGPRNRTRKKQLLAG